MPVIASISGIRGTIGGDAHDSLTPTEIVGYTSAYATWVCQGQKSAKVVVGRDARQSGPAIAKLVCGTLNSHGIEVINLGLSTTPTVEVAVEMEGAAGGIILTASHNPGHWNALKLLNHKGEFISAEEGKAILDIKESGQYRFVKPAAFGVTKNKKKYLDKHIERILALDLVDKDAIEAKDFRVVVDGINSSGALAVPALLNAIGVYDVEVINAEPNGQFAHNPEPLEENLHGIAERIKDDRFDLGIVVDPDVDRLAFMCENGDCFGEEFTLVAIADYVLQHKKGPTVSNLSSSRALRDITEKHGCVYYPAAVGEVNVVNKMKEQGAVIGGEGNGGIIVPELHYGRDALVGIAYLLTYLAKSGLSMTQLRKQYPSYAMAKEKIELTPDIDVDAILEEIAKKYAKEKVNRIDGVKIDFEDKWVHLRKSNTEPIIRIYTEAHVKATAQTLANKLIEDIRDLI